MPSVWTRGRSAALAALALWIQAPAPRYARAADPTTAAKSSGPQPLSISELAKHAQTADLSEEALRDAVLKRPDPKLTLSFSNVLPLGSGQHAVAWSTCDQKSCRGAVGVLRSEGSDGKRVVLSKQQALVLPPRVFMDDGVLIQAIALSDLDGDKQPELLIDYRVQEPPRPALGSLSHQYYAVYNVPLLTPAWHFEVRKSGGSVEPVCEWEVAHQIPQPPERASGPILTATGGCKPDASAASGPIKTKRFSWNKTSKRFLPAP